MTRIPAIRALLLLSVLSGCSDPEGDPEPTPPEPSPSKHEPEALGPVWKATSERLELSTFSYFGGSMAYDITRDLLSAEQLSLLQDLQEIDTPPGPLGADFASYRIRITDRSGEVTEYRAAEDDVIDSDEGATEGARSIEYESLSPFLATFHCLSAKEAGPYDANAPESDTWNGVATFNSDPGCMHGVFIASADTNRKWQVDAAGSYRLSLVSCFQQTTLHLFDASGQHELAASAVATDPDCASLTYTFSEPGVYRVVLHRDRTPAQDYDGFGDMMFQVSPQ